MKTAFSNLSYQLPVTRFPSGQSLVILITMYIALVATLLVLTHFTLANSGHHVREYDESRLQMRSAKGKYPSPIVPSDHDPSWQNRVATYKDAGRKAGTSLNKTPAGRDMVPPRVAAAMGGAVGIVRGAMAPSDSSAAYNNPSTHAQDEKARPQGKIASTIGNCYDGICNAVNRVAGTRLKRDLDNVMDITTRDLFNENWESDGLFVRDLARDEDIALWI